MEIKVKGEPRILLHEMTREWEFEHQGVQHTFREYEGLDGRQMWFNGEEVEDFDSEILGELSAYDIYCICSEKYRGY